MPLCQDYVWSRADRVDWLSRLSRKCLVCCCNEVQRRCWGFLLQKAAKELVVCDSALDSGGYRASSCSKPWNVVSGGRQGASALPQLVPDGLALEGSLAGRTNA